MTTFCNINKIKDSWYKEFLTCKVFYIHISSLTDEFLDAAYLSPDCCSVQPSLSSLIPFIHFVFGFRCRVWCSLLTQTGLWLMLWCCVCLISIQEKFLWHICFKNFLCHFFFVYYYNSSLYKVLIARRGQSYSNNQQQNGWTYFTWAHFITFTRLNQALITFTLLSLHSYCPKWYLKRTHLNNVHAFRHATKEFIYK